MIDKHELGEICAAVAYCCAVALLALAIVLGLAVMAGAQERGLSPPLRTLIAKLRADHGPGAVRVIAGRANRYVAGTSMRSCHSTGDAFDAHLSAPAKAAVRRTGFGIITYSGGMSHWHISSCRREAGLRAHKGGWPRVARGI